MKTLIIASQYPLPEIGGNRMRTMNFVRYFKQYGTVDLAWYQDGAEPPEGEYPFGKQVAIIRGDGPASALPLREQCGRLWPGKPWIVCSYSDNNLRQLRELIEQEQYDRIVCRYAVSAYPLLFLPERLRHRIIIDIDDIISPELYHTVHGTLSGIRSLRSWLDYHCYRRYQIACARLGTTLVCSAADLQQLAARAPDADIHVVPNVAPLLQLPRSYQWDGFKQLKTLLFVGNLAYPPNLDGLRWFIETILPEATVRFPGLKLLIAGKEPVPWLRDLCSRYEQLELIETPETIIPLYERCGAVIVPLLSGGGTRIKILEAGLAKRPVLSTPLGAFGLDLKDRHSVLTFETCERFLEQLAWLSDHQQYRSLTNALQQLVTEHFSVAAFNCAVEQAISPQLPSLPGAPVAGLVSVIVPVYNRAALVSKTLDSILAQTWQGLEIIAVNDGSSDNSLAVLQRYAAKYPGVVRVIDQPNSGQVKARNAGIRQARGSFIAFLDSDDTWAPEKLALQLPLFRSGIGLVYCGINEVSTEHRLIKTVPCETGMRGGIYPQLLIRNRMTGGSVVVTRQALERVGLFDETLQAAENWDLWIRIAKEFQVDYINRPLVNYLRHPGNLSSNPERMSQSVRSILKKHLTPARRNKEAFSVYHEAHALFHYNLGVSRFSAERYLQAMRAFLLCWSHRPFYRDSVQRMLRSLLGSRLNRWLSCAKNKCRLLLTKERHDPASC